MSRYGTTFALALIHAHLAACYSSPANPGIALPSLPAPKPARTQTAADLERIQAAEAKRQRRIERNKQRGDV